MSEHRFTHLNEQGLAKMVDVSDKVETARLAVAQARVCMNEQTWGAVREGRMKKGDVLAVAQVAGVMAAKNTAQWIPMCHPIPISGVDLQFHTETPCLIIIEATVKTKSVTGVEMEALTAVSAAALTVYDMCKSADKGITIEQVMLLRKHGGKSGDFVRENS